MKSKKLLDTSLLIGFWRQARKKAHGKATPELARAWARQLIQVRKTDAIVTPVYIEMIAGVTDKDELKAAQAFLGEFRCIDEGNILEIDWQEAIRIAQRVPRDGKPRQLGDCLIRAIANRLKHKVDTSDSGFPF